MQIEWSHEYKRDIVLILSWYYPPEWLEIVLKLYIEYIYIWHSHSPKTQLIQWRNTLQMDWIHYKVDIEHRKSYLAPLSFWKKIIWFFFFVTQRRKICSDNNLNYCKIFYFMIFLYFYFFLINVPAFVFPVIHVQCFNEASEIYIFLLKGEKYVTKKELP